MLIQWEKEKTCDDSRGLLDLRPATRNKPASADVSVILGSFFHDPGSQLAKRISAKGQAVNYTAAKPGWRNWQTRWP
jgi:hypothetical protein